MRTAWIKHDEPVVSGCYTLHTVGIVVVFDLQEATLNVMFEGVEDSSELWVNDTPSSLTELLILILVPIKPTTCMGVSPPFKT